MDNPRSYYQLTPNLSQTLTSEEDTTYLQSNDPLFQNNDQTPLAMGSLLQDTILQENSITTPNTTYLESSDFLFPENQEPGTLLENSNTTYLDQNTESSEFHQDSYFEDDFLFPENQTSEEPLAMGTLLENSNTTFLDQNTFHQDNYFQNDKLKTYILYLNKNISIYNDNIKIYQKTAAILEQYFSCIFTSISNSFEFNINMLKKSRINDIRNNTVRNYELLLKYIKHFYKAIYNIVIYKISEIEQYMQATEKILMQHSFQLIQQIWFCHYQTLLPVNQGINHYENYHLYKVFNEIRDKLEEEYHTYTRILFSTRSSLDIFSEDDI